jgi:hypothetical protein
VYLHIQICYCVYIQFPWWYCCAVAVLSALLVKGNLCVHVYLYILCITEWYEVWGGNTVGAGEDGGGVGLFRMYNSIFDILIKTYIHK